VIGKQIGHYEVTGLLGKGGMGEVYRARDTRLNREVAIKVLPPEFADDPERLARFRREARLLASLNHTHIAALHGLEEVDGAVFLAMELVEGEDLAERLERGPLDLDEALDLARQFAEGLETAHEQNIVHRDLKPANLKATPDGQLKILDFGLARAYLGDRGDSELLDQSPTITAALTGHGVILGTAAYMSPEQARGRKIDHRSDIWSFGVILFELLSGQRVFRGETMSDTMAAVLRADPPWADLPAETPAGVRRLLERCLERDHRRRLRDIGEARIRLERWRDQPESMHESYMSGVSEPVPIPQRKVSLPWVLFTGALLIAAILGWRLTTVEPPGPRVFDLEIGVVNESELAAAGNLVTLSPDGDWMAWITPGGIHLRHVSRRLARVLEGTAGASSLCFSPDGAWIGFSGRGELRRVSISGGAPISICELPTPRGLAWVDASTIVYSPVISSGLFKADIRSGITEALTELDHDRNERSHRWPTAVPDQRAVMFECQFLGRDYDQSDIQMVSLDTGVRTTVHRGGAAPVVTTDGQLLFVRKNTLFAVAFDIEEARVLGLPVPVRENVMASVGNQEDDDGSAQFTVDRRGTLLYLDDGGRGSRLSQMAWFDLGSGAISLFGPIAEHGDLMLSPDNKMAVVSRVRDTDENLYAIDLATGNETVLTHRLSVEYAGAWSPDSRVFYWSQSSDAGDRFEIWRRPVDGTAPPEFVIASPTGAGVWPNDISPDGRYLACSAWMGADMRDVLVLDLEDVDAGFSPLIAGDENQDYLHWFGPDHVVYREGAGGSGTLMMRRFPDTGALWSFPGTELGYAMGIPDTARQSLLVVGPGGIDRFDVSIVDGRAQIGQARSIRVSTEEEQRRIVNLVVHPDGKRALGFYSTDPAGAWVTPTLVMVTGWVQGLSRRLQDGH